MIDPVVSLWWTAFLIVLGSLLFWPKHGLFWRWQNARQITSRVLREDALKHVHQCETIGIRPTLTSVAGALRISVNEVAALLGDMEEHDLLQTKSGEFRLTQRGRLSALHIIRAHRLWERHLADETGFNESEWHDRADRVEHMLSPGGADVLFSRLGNPSFDPHGDPIPTAGGEIVSHRGSPLTSMEINEPLQIVHIEDEPEAVYAQLVAEGLHPGLEVRITEIARHRICIWAGGDEHIIAPIVADNISVVVLQQPADVLNDDTESLSNLHPGERGSVVSISAACRGLERRRLMDLGILPGTVITAKMRGPSGDPTAYRIRDALIALRREQAERISVTRLAVAST